MKRLISGGTLALILATANVTEAGAVARKPVAPGEERQSYTVTVDEQGVMRRSDNGEEVSYYGTNYTVPFAYSYRALGYLGRDRREAIDRDIYHIARLGLNAFRLHLWDAELTDSEGNLLDNDHLDLLDYMISRLEERGIDVVLTAQTNFGNGYPERNIDTGAFTYDFDKCNVHENRMAQEIQERYLMQLAEHVNPYTGRSYAGDRAIIAMEINNEPCHSGTEKEVTAYIDRMAHALRKAGFDKPILYNVTHNPGVTTAYYAAKDIDGTTYQWYPTGLVAGHERKGNFLPAIDDYTIPWKKTMPGYDRLARVVYEFDPADVLYSHLYPAVARTFRKEGFQWITQFAYDPIDLAPYNTEYPTHFLNLVYTPAKALSMMVAAEAAREIPRGADYGSYPQNTRFGHTRISYEEDLSEFNSPDKFIYTNNTPTNPADTSGLQQIAGHGNSPVGEYSGSGAYFLDRLENSDVWRLEVMPNVTVIEDPFGDTDLKNTKVIATSAAETMRISLPSLGMKFYYKGIDVGNKTSGQATEGKITVMPGTYLLQAASPDFPAPDRLGRGKVAANIGLTEYAAPLTDSYPVTLLSRKEADPALDVNMIPEAWNYRLESLDLGWDAPKFYELKTTPDSDGITVLKRYVGDKMARIPEEIKLNSLHARFIEEAGNHKSTGIPEGTMLSLTFINGATFSAPVRTDSTGTANIQVNELMPSEGVIVPAPYPTMLARLTPTTDGKRGEMNEIESVTLTIPQKKGVSQNILIERIWVE